MLVGTRNLYYVSLSIHAVLSGTKYGLKQTRGKFGLGAKMVLATFPSLNIFPLCFCFTNSDNKLVIVAMKLNYILVSVDLIGLYYLIYAGTNMV